MRHLLILSSFGVVGLAILTLSRQAPAAAQLDPPRSSDWLRLLPDGEEKRQFILDCTGCHQMDARHTRPNGKPRTEAEWEAAITRMLGYAGGTTGFPVISGAREAKPTAQWLARHFAADPVPAAITTTPGAPRAEVTEFEIPAANDLPHDLAIDAGGKVIITGMFTHQMYVLDPGTGAFETISIPVQGANPRALEIDRAGNWWVVLGARNALARYTPTTMQWKTWPVGMYPHSLALHPDGTVWYNGHFTRDPEQIGRVDAAGEGTKTFNVPSHPTLAQRPGGPIPYELRTAPDGKVWGSELAGNRVFSFDPRSEQFEVYDMPMTHSGPRRLDIDAQGIVWIPAYASNELVRLDPRTKRFERFPLPIADAVPYVVRSDPGTSRLWIAASSADVMFAFDTRTRAFTTYPLPSRGALVRHLAVDARTHDVWIAYGQSPSTIAAKVARLRLRQ